jgi:RNA polymerase sigma-70 factor (ECF subfamily)
MEATTTDQTLVEQVRAGSPEAAATLFHAHWQPVWRAAFAITGSREDADDVAQEAFLTALRRIDRYDAERPFGPWIRRIAANLAIDHARRAARHARAADDEGLCASPVDWDGHEDLARALTRLAFERRAVIVLRFLLGYPLEDVAQLLGIPRGTASSRATRGLAELRVLLEDYGAD